MSNEALRELVVSIDFDHIDISGLTRLDRTLDQIERNLREAGAQSDRMGNRIDQAADEARRALDRLGGQADQTGGDIREVGSDADRMGDRIDEAARRARQSLDEMGDEAANAGERAANGNSKILDVLNEIIPQGRAAGLAATLFSNPWTVAAAGVTAAIVGVGAAMVGIAIDAEKNFDRIKALTGTTGQRLEDLQGAAKDVFRAGFGEDLRTVGDDVARLNGMFEGMSRQGIAELSKDLYTLQDLWPNADMETTSRTLKNMMANFQGLDSEKATDLITYAFQNGGDYAGDLLDTLSEYSIYFNKLGVPVEKFVGTLLKGSKAGAFNMDKIGDAFKEVGIRSIDSSETTRDAFKQLGFDAKDLGNKFALGGDSAHQALMATVSALSFVDDETQRNAIGVQLFGTQWEDLSKNVIFSIDRAEEAVNGFQGATNRATDDLRNNVSSKWQTFWREIKTEVIDSMDGSGASINRFMDGLLSTLPTVKGVIHEITDDLKFMMQLLSFDLGGALESFRGSVREEADSAKKMFSGIANFFGGSSEDEDQVQRRYIDSGQEVTNGLINGMTSKANSLADAAASVGNTINDSFRDFFRIKSPSRLMMENGEYISEGLGIGISDGAANAVAAVSGVSQGIAQSAAPEAVAGQAAAPGVGIAGATITVPVVVNVPAGMTAEDAKGIGRSVRDEVQDAMLSFFKQLGYNF